MTIPRSMTIIGGKVTGRILGRGVNDVTIDGTEVTGGAGTTSQQGTIDFDDSDRITVRNVHVHDALGACVDLTRGEDNVIENGRFIRCGQQGYHLSDETDTVIRGNEFAYNNDASAPGPRYDPGFEAGGGKAAWQRGALFENNISHHNGGPGLWCDLDCRGVTFRGNRVYDNNGIGIFYEISHDGLIEGNVLYRNGTPGGNAYSGHADIRVSSSRTTIVRQNVMAWSPRGIVILAQNRSESRTGYAIPTTYEGDRSEGNVVISSGQNNIHGWYQADGKRLDVTGNGSSGDRFWSSALEPQSARYEWASSPKSTLSSYQSTPGGSGASYLNVFEKDVILSANGMPAQP